MTPSTGVVIEKSAASFTGLVARRTSRSEPHWPQSRDCAIITRPTDSALTQVKLQQATRYAIWSIIELASREGEQVSANDIAQKYAISHHHLAKVLRTLARARIVSSVRGPGGGFTFTGKANRLTLYDIITLFERDWPDNGDHVAAPENNTVADEVGRVLDEIDRITSATLRSVTVQTIIRNAERAAAKAHQPRTSSDKRKE